MGNVLPIGLEFINKFKVTNSSLENSTWRINNFDDDVWECKFGSERRTIDFNKRLDDNTFLIEPKNRNLLVSIKKYLCLQTHPALTGSIISNSTTDSLKISIALQVIDYFLIRSSEFKISEYGFNFITENDISVFISILTESKHQKNSIYDPSTVIKNFLEKVEIDGMDLSELRTKSNYLYEIDSTEDLFLSEEQTIKARLWLKLNGFYLRNHESINHEYSHYVSRRKLLDHIIGERILGSMRFHDIELPGLDMKPYKSFSRELPNVPVNNSDDDERASIEYTSSYIAALKSMQVARQNGINMIPEAALQGIESSAVILKEKTKERTRFTTLPFHVANELLSKAFEFYFEYGNSLIDTYLNLAYQGAHPEAMNVTLPPELTKLGVTTWVSSATSAPEFFEKLRNGNSLFNMLEVLFGAISIIVATLTARRKSELSEITTSSIVKDNGAYFLAINLRKANVLEHRQRALRPIPKIVADALLLLSRFNHGLKDLGYPTKGFLFELPVRGWSRTHYFGTCLPDFTRINNRFCDYYQTGLDEQGRRYYVRTHQLRRNFAMLFFWKGSFGGIEVLRHFLGHSKPSMTYRYITEATPGKVLQRVKANSAKELIQRNDNAVEDLSNLLCERYGLTMDKLHILPEQDILAYIEDLLASGEAEIEPEFFKCANGEDYKIVYKVKNKTGD